MLVKPGLILLAYFTSITCTFSNESKQSPRFTDIETSKNLQLSVNSLAGNQQKLTDPGLLPATKTNLERSYPLSIKLSSVKQRGSDEWVSNQSKQKNYDSPTRSVIAAKPASYMTLKRTGRRNALGNPLYQLRLYANGQSIGAYTAVSGREYTQNRNRNQAGTEAPLPDGRYKVARAPIPGTIVEAGDRFLPIQPLFRTGRSALGIHYDPSFEKDNGEDGTSGCIALTDKRELNQVLNYVRTYQPKYLEVNIQ